MRVTHDVIVVGGSFAGLSAALQVARARRRVLVIDSGAPRNRFADSAHGFFAQDGRAPSAVLAAARAQLLAYPEVDMIDGEATSARRDGDALTVTLCTGETFSGSRLILATGLIDELPPVPGLEERWGRSVLHCPYCHAYEIGGDRLGVLATAPSAPDLALLLGDWGRVTLFAQGVELDSGGVEKFLSRGGKIDQTPIVAVEGDDPESITLTLGDGRNVELDALFLVSRQHLASDLARQFGCRISQGSHGPVVVTDENKETSVEGVYAAGDMAREAHNASLASADGVTAGIAAHQSLVTA